jgi:hypothetical protein
MADVYTILSNASPTNEHSTQGTLLDLLRHGHREEALGRAHMKDEINQIDDGSTPLLVATTRGWEDVVEVLVRNGANVNVISDLGETPLMRAIKCGKISPHVIKLILDHGGNETLNVSAKDNAFFSKWTALHFACDTEMNHSPVVIALLVSYGANAKAVAGNGRTPHDMCAQNPEYQKALSKPRDYLKTHTLDTKPYHDENDEGRHSGGEPMQLGSDRVSDDSQPRSSMLQNAFGFFKPKKSSLIQVEAPLPTMSPVNSEANLLKAKSKVL